MIPCLNTHPDWVSTLKGYVEDVKAGSDKMILS